MRWQFRAIIVLLAMGAIVVGVPRLPPASAFFLFLVCVILMSSVLAPVLTQYGATAFVDFIYSTNGTTAETDIEDPAIYAQSQNVFSLLRTISFLVLAAALYGFHWSVPILRQWPPAAELTTIPRSMVPAFAVMILSTLVWVFYLSLYFIPTFYGNLRDRWVNWRYPAAPRD